MLEQILQVVSQGGIRSVQELAERLLIPPPLLETMLEDLARLGYLRAVDDACRGRCDGCAMGGCSVAGPGRVWMLTDKGARAAVRSGH